ncbi:hypothetical protein V0288_00670 [Pannus brasiliensis CCIBt3594]|uniref:Uncharacterized protein n=1 Tax=Pannus brasiliensis CCIBt3594 TaxID=1427578 RepID=A0AAW9QKE1_9CHRO
MSDRETIPIEVPSEIARFYRSASPEEKERIGLQLTDILRSIVENSREQAIDRLKKSLEKVRREAGENSLTSEILESSRESDRKPEKDRLGRIMDEIGNKSIERGLTMEILAEILQENE